MRIQGELSQRGNDELKKKLPATRHFLKKQEMKKREQTEGIARIAELEDQMAVNDASAESAHPRKKKGLLSCIFLRLTRLLSLK